MTQAFQNAATRTIQVKDTNMVYRELGKRGGVPVVFLHHLTAVLDDWDPKVLDGIAGSHHVVIFDNRGVGGSGGQTPVSVADMAEDAIAFIEALGFALVDLFGFSLGGFVAQVIAQTRPELVRKIVLAGTGPAGGIGISDVGTILQGAFQRAGAEHKHPKHFLFFSSSPQGQKAADAFLQRLGERQADRDMAVSDQTVQAQLTAIVKWGQAASSSETLKQVRHPVLIANGDADVMVPTPNSIALFEALPMRSSASSRMRATAASSSTPTPSSIRRSAFSQNSDALHEPGSCLVRMGEIRTDPLPPGTPRAAQRDVESDQHSIWLEKIMPLWKVYHPVGAYSAQDKKEFAEKVTAMYSRIPIPKFYVVMIFEEVAAESFYVGGASHGKFVRLKLEHMARTLPGPIIREWWVKAVDQLIVPFVRDRGYDWEVTIDEVPADLWSLQGEIPPPFESHAEKRWVKENKVSPYGLREKLPVGDLFMPGVTEKSAG